MSEKKVVYIAELDADVDDVVAADYLYRENVLRCLVCDPYPKTAEGKERLSLLKNMGVPVVCRIPDDAAIVFVGGALTSVAGHLVQHELEYLVMNGGFVGSNIVAASLPKFDGKEMVRTFNFNCDVVSTDRVLRSPNVVQTILVGKNVCHDRRNTRSGIWSDEHELLDRYHVKPEKRLHDLLACREGLVQTGLLNEKSYLLYDTVWPVNSGLNGKMTLWGSTKGRSSYQAVLAAVGWQET